MEPRVTARLRIAQGEVQRQLTGPSGMATQYVMRQTRAIRNRAVMYVPVDTGNLRSSIVTAVQHDGLRVIGMVGTPVEYAAAVHEGWTTAKGKRVPGRPYLRRALEETMGR